MGSGPANHDLAVAGTVVSEFSHATENAIELFERFVREEETKPFMGVLARMVQEDVFATEAGLPPPFGGPGKELCLHQVLWSIHHEISHPPATPHSQESVQPLPPSSYPTMRGGLADHELAADGIARIEPWTKCDFAMLEDRGTMRGLGINGPHHVLSSVSVKETASRTHCLLSSVSVKKQRPERKRRLPRGAAVTRGSLKVAWTKLPFLPFLEWGWWWLCDNALT